MVNTHFWLQADALGIDVFLLGSLIRRCLKQGQKQNNKTSRASLLHCQGQPKWRWRYFCQLYRSPWGKKKKKMLYIFHITCCKVLICEALIKTLLNDLWIAISHSAFLLFYTFLWVTIGAFTFVCILLTNQLLLKTVHRINGMEFLKRCFQLTIVQT